MAIYDIRNESFRLQLIRYPINGLALKDCTLERPHVMVRLPPGTPGRFKNGLVDAGELTLWTGGGENHLIFRIPRQSNRHMPKLGREIWMQKKNFHAC